VVIRFATVAPSDRRVFVKTVEWDLWIRGGGTRSHGELQDRFVEIGEYGACDEPVVLVRLLDSAPRPATRAPGETWMGVWRDQ